MACRSSGTRIANFAKSGDELDSQASNVNTTGAQAFGMDIRGLDEMGDRRTELLLQLENTRSRPREVYEALDLRNHITVTRMQLDHLDSGVLGGQYPVKGLRFRSSRHLDLFGTHRQRYSCLEDNHCNSHCPQPGECQTASNRSSHCHIGIILSLRGHRSEDSSRRVNRSLEQSLYDEGSEQKSDDLDEE